MPLENRPWLDLSLEVRTQTNNERSKLLLTFGSKGKWTQAVSLSEGCGALLNDGGLRGFYVILSRDAAKTPDPP